MKLLVCGSRAASTTSEQLALLETHLDRLKSGIDLLIHGDASGIDTASGEWAEANGVNYCKVPAIWGHYGKSAGMIRNRAMIDLLEPDHVLAFPSDNSIGTWGCVRYAAQQGIEHTVVMPDGEIKVYNSKNQLSLFSN
jgi:hypothetical protein